MASNPNKAAAAPPVGASSYDQVVLQALLSRLQLRPPYLDNNSLLPQSLDDFLLRDGGSDDEEEEEEEEDGGEGSSNRRLLAKEEAKLEKEVVRIIHSGSAVESLKANSGQSVSIGDHNICVAVHEEPGSEYRVWEWHGHIMFFDQENGYSAEYIYGNYFERLSETKKKEGRKAVSDEEDGEGGSKVNAVGNSGLKELIEDPKDEIGNGSARVVHRNSLKDRSRHLMLPVPEPLDG